MELVINTMRLALLAIALFVSLAVTSVSAVSDDNVPILPIATAYIYPNNPPTLIPAGQDVEFLVSFSNKAHVHLNLTSLEGSVNSPLNFNQYIQNFTVAKYDTVVAPGREATLKYSFRPDIGLVGRKFQVCHVLTYRTGQYIMDKTVFNSTVIFTEPNSSLFDSTSLLLLFQLLSMIAIGGFFAMKELEKRGLLSFGSKAEIKPTKASKPEDWLPGSFFAADKKADSPKSPKKKRN